MSTIAWDGRMLAADTRGVIGESLPIESHKLYRLTEGRLYAAVGTKSDLLLAKEWLLMAGEKPALDESFAALLVLANGQCVRLEDKLVALPVCEPFVALGSGRDFALAAMALGQTAEQAVALAARFDIWTGMPIDTLRLKE